MVITTSDSAHIAAWYVPAQDSAGARHPGPHPGLLVLPREGEPLDRRLDLVAAMARRGFSVLALDHRGHGASEAFAVDPRYLVYPEYLTDARSGLSILWARPEVDTTQVAVYGESVGALLALATAGSRPEVRAVVAVSTPYNWKEYRKLLERDEPGKEFLVPEGWKRRDEPDKVIRRFNGAVLFVTGDMDTRTPVWMTEDLHAKYPRPKELWIVPGAGHAGKNAPRGLLGDGFCARVAEFLLRELKKEPHRGWPHR